MNPIAIFYHCLFYLDNRLLEPAVHITREQMDLLRVSGLLNAAQEIVVGINGGKESLDMARLILPAKANLVCHGLQCHTELRTILMLHEFSKNHPDWFILYFHCKGATRPPEDAIRTIWRRCMMRHLVGQWQQCVSDLGEVESVGCHWMTYPKTPVGQSIWAGNFWWSRSDFIAALPSIDGRDRIKESGLDSVDSRYESEVWIGNGTRLPSIRDYHPDWDPSKYATCL